jgi:predicted enzyme related to lactoylglutathione lyase
VAVGGPVDRRHDAQVSRNACGDAAGRGVYFAVADTDATVAKAQELGASVFMGPTDIEPGRFAVLADNVGAVFNVLQLKA